MIVERGVKPDRIVEEFDVLADGLARFGLAPKAASVDELLLERREETLDRRVVPAVAGPAHRHRRPQRQDGDFKFAVFIKSVVVLSEDPRSFWRGHVLATILFIRAGRNSKQHCDSPAHNCLSDDREIEERSISLKWSNANSEFPDQANQISSDSHRPESHWCRERPASANSSGRANTATLYPKPGCYSVAGCSNCRA